MKKQPNFVKYIYIFLVKKYYSYEKVDCIVKKHYNYEIKTNSVWKIKLLIIILTKIVNIL